MVHFNNIPPIGVEPSLDIVAGIIVNATRFGFFLPLPCANDFRLIFFIQ